MINPEIKYGLEVKFGTSYGDEEVAAVIKCLEDNAPSCGKKVKEFEDAFAAYCGVDYALTSTSATTALFLAGIAAGVKPGDEVITTPLSWIATASAFSTLGAKVVFCDINPRTFNLDPDLLEACITRKTKAIVPVHVYGQCCEMDRILEIAGRHGIVVIDDCAHNPGGEYLGRKSGSLADMSVFSFHQQKNMSTLGEGGMITTGSREFYEKILSFRSLCCRQYGGSSKYLPIDEQEHPMGRQYWRLFFDDIGYNFRMTDIQAAVGLEQLKKLDAHNARRVELSSRLTGRLEGIRGLTLPYVDPKGRHVFHLYVVQLEKDFPLGKDDFMWEMYEHKGIKVWNHYMPIHLTQPYLDQGHKAGECPVVEAAFKKYVSLPMHPRLTDEAIDYMAASVRELAGL
ncbi:MAG: DegT/DnrJ/EryC1/StrS family aminotransferase [Clostridia bacterium]|nr:DegT/DnrJ/EryC1/StrS family aminotransferase [Clostridia bacterium]